MSRNRSFYLVFNKCAIRRDSFPYWFAHELSTSDAFDFQHPIWNLHLVEVAFPFSNVLYLKESLNCCSLSAGKPCATMRVLENRMRFRLRPALFMGCSYILTKLFSLFLIINNYNFYCLLDREERDKLLQLLEREYISIQLVSAVVLNQ